MAGPLIAIVGDADPIRTFNPVMKDPAKAKQAAEELGKELATRGARLLVYGGPYIEADVVRGFVAGKPAEDHSIVKWYSQAKVPPLFSEEQTHPNLFEQHVERGPEWEIAFYRSITRADGIILIGGEKATKISGQVAIGTRMPILALQEFGGGAHEVWTTLSAGEDLPTRDEIDLMAKPWANDSAAACVKALFAQRERRRSTEVGPSPLLSILAALLFLLAFAIVPWRWSKNAATPVDVWMLFAAPLLAGGAGAAIRPLVDRLRGLSGAAPAVLATVIFGLVAGGMAGVLFVTAQLTADPTIADSTKVGAYAFHSLPYAVGVGFVAGLTADAVFGKLLGLDVLRTSGIDKAGK